MLHFKDFQNVYSSPNIVRKIKWVGYTELSEKMINSQINSVTKHEVKNPLLKT